MQIELNVYVVEFLPTLRISTYCKYWLNVVYFIFVHLLLIMNEWTNEFGSLNREEKMNWIYS